MLSLLYFDCRSGGRSCCQSCSWPEPKLLRKCRRKSRGQVKFALQSCRASENQLQLYVERWTQSSKPLARPAHKGRESLLPETIMACEASLLSNALIDLTKKIEQAAPTLSTMFSSNATTSLYLQKLALHIFAGSYSLSWLSAPRLRSYEHLAGSAEPHGAGHSGLALSTSGQNKCFSLSACSR